MDETTKQILHENIVLQSKIHKLEEQLSDYSSIKQMNYILMEQIVKLKNQLKENTQ